MTNEVKNIKLIISDENKEPFQSSKLDLIEKVSKIISIIAIPIIVALIGSLIQKNLSDNSLDKEYVKIASDILSDSEKIENNEELRKWAVDLINATAPVKISDTAKEALKKGAISFPSSNAYYTIQISVTKDIDAAKKIKDSLAKLGFLNVMIRDRHLNDETNHMYSVEIGSFTDLSVATDYLDKLKKSNPEFTQSFIKKIQE